MLQDINREITIQDVYPDLTPEEQVEAEEFLKAYVAVLGKIFKRIEAEKRRSSELQEG